MPEPERRPAFYAAGAGGWRDWWTILHPPYTAWHLSYVVIGASLAPHVDAGRLLATLLAFFLAVGIAAHLLDELHGRPASLPAAGRRARVYSHHQKRQNVCGGTENSRLATGAPGFTTRASSRRVAAGSAT